MPNCSRVCSEPGEYQMHVSRLDDTWRRRKAQSSGKGRVAGYHQWFHEWRRGQRGQPTMVRAECGPVEAQSKVKTWQLRLPGKPLLVEVYNWSTAIWLSKMAN